MIRVRLGRAAVMDRGGGPVGLDRVFSRVEKITSVGAMIGSLEELATLGDLNDDGIFAWPVHRTRFRGLDRFPLRSVTRLFDYPTVAIIPLTQLVASGRLLFGRPGRRERALLLAAASGATAGMGVHHVGGADGSDHMSFVSFVVAALEKGFSQDERAQQACVQFLAFQACVAYAVSGAVKLVSPTWRDGTAITGIFRTRTYGDARLYRMLKVHPIVPRVMAWTVILGELTFPLVLVAPKPVARGILATACVFHLANGRFMGLNRFLWAFTATYPAVAHVSRSLRP